MSQVSVYTDLILRDAQFKEQLRAMEAEVLASAKRIGAAGFRIPLTIEDQATAQVEQILAKIRAQDVKLTIGLDDAFSAQLATLRTEAAVPIRVPVVLDMPDTAAVAALAGPAAVAATALTGGAGGGAIVAGGGTGAGGIDPTSAAAIEATAAAEARAASSSNAARVATGRNSFFGGGAWRAAFHAMIVGRAAYDTGAGVAEAAQAAYYGGNLNPLLEATGNAPRGGGMDDLLRLQQSIAAGQKSIRNIPIAGEFIEGTGDVIERGASALGNYLDTNKQHSYAGKFESDRGYSDRLTEETRIQDEHNKQLEHEVELRHQLEQIVDRTVRQQRGRAELAEAQPLERPDITARLGRENLEAEISANPLFKDAKGRETEDAKRYRAAEQAAIEAQQKRDTERAIAENNRAGLGHRAVVADLGEAQREADLRAQGQTEQAALAARHYAVNAQLRAFENRADTALPGSEEKRRATEEFEAAKPAAAAEHQAIDVAERERVADSVNRYEIEAERAKLSAVRGSYNEELRAFEKMWDAKLAKIQDSQEKAAAIQARDAERTAMVTRHAEDIADIKASTHEIELRTAGKDKEADVFRVTEEARKALDAAGDDLEKKGELLAHERAQLEALRHEDRGAIFGSVTSFARDVSVRNMRNTGGADIQAAIDAANAEQAAVDAARRGQPAPPTAPGAPAPPATADVTPTEPDYTQRQPGETLDAYRNRGGRAFRANPLTASAEARRRRGIDLRREREAHEQAVTSAGADAASFTDATMPGGFMDFEGQYNDERRVMGVINAGLDSKTLADSIMPGGDWFGALHPAGPTQPEPGDMMHGAFAAGDTGQPGAFGGNADLAKLLADVQVQPDLAQNALSAADIANPTMDAIKAAMRPAGAGGGDMGGMFSAGGDDPQAKRDFKDGSSDLKDAAASLNRTLSDEKNRLYVVR